jgi:hypothetical protein
LLTLGYVEYVIARAGYTSVQAPLGGDYGVDLYMFSYDQQGYAESGQVRIQVRSAESFDRLADGKTVVARVDRKHLNSWLAEAPPVALVLYEASTDSTAWIEVHAASAVRGGGTRSVTLHGDMSRPFDVQSVQRLAAEKQAWSIRMNRALYDD